MNKISLIEFSKQFLSFKPTPLQEKLMEYLIEDNKHIVLNGGRSWYKKQIKDEFTCGALLKMKEKERFALASPDGARIFEMVEFRKYIK